MEWKEGPMKNLRRSSILFGMQASFLPSFLSFFPPLFTRREWTSPPSHVLSLDSVSTRDPPDYHHQIIIERFGLMGFHSPERIKFIPAPCILMGIVLQKKFFFYTNLCLKIHRGKKKSFDRMIRRKILITRQRLFGSFNYEREGN